MYEGERACKEVGKDAQAHGPVGGMGGRGRSSAGGGQWRGGHSGHPVSRATQNLELAMFNLIFLYLVVSSPALTRRS